MTQIHKFGRVHLHNTWTHSTIPHVHTYPLFSRMCTHVYTQMRTPVPAHTYNPFTNDDFSGVEIPAVNCVDFDTLEQKVPE